MRQGVDMRLHHDHCHVPGLSRLEQPDSSSCSPHVMSLQYAPSHQAAAHQFLSLHASEMLHHMPSIPNDSSPVTMHPNLVSTLKSILSPMSQDPGLSSLTAAMLPVNRTSADHMMVEGCSISGQQLSHMQCGSVRGGDLMVPAGDMLQPDLAGKGLQYLLGLNQSDGLVSDGQPNLAHGPNSQAAVCAELEYMARANHFLRQQQQQRQQQQNACCQADMMMKQMCHEQQLASFQQELQNNVVVDHLQSAFGPNVVEVQNAEMDVLAHCNMMQEAMKFNDMMMQSKHLMRSCSAEQSSSQPTPCLSSHDFQYVNLCMPDTKFEDIVDSKGPSFCSGSELDLVVCGELSGNGASNVNVVPEGDTPLYAPQFDDHQVVDRGPSHQHVRQDPPVLQSLPASSNSSGGENSCEDQQAAVIPLDLIQNRRPFRCTHAGCNKTFKNPQTMRMHRKTHATVGGGSSSTAASQTHSSSLSAICKAGQNKKIPCRCPICKRTFVGLYELRRHFGRKHTQGEKRHACRKCGKRFYIEVDLRDHEKICGEPMECKCGMKFAFKCNLVAHKKAHPECQDLLQVCSSSEEDKSSSAGKKSTTALYSPLSSCTSFSKLRSDISDFDSCYNAGLMEHPSISFASSHMPSFLNMAAMPASSVVSSMGNALMTPSVASACAVVKEEVVTAMPLSASSLNYCIPDVTCTGFQLPSGLHALPHSSVA